MELKELEKKFEKGFKVDFSKVQRAIKKCDEEKDIKECKTRLKEIGIEWYD